VCTVTGRVRKIQSSIQINIYTTESKSKALMRSVLYQINRVKHGYKCYCGQYNI